MNKIQRNKSKGIGSYPSLKRTRRYLGIKFRFICLLLIIFHSITGSISAQTVSVRGKIADSSTGEAIIGANILISGTLKGVISDEKGNFSIEASPDATLVFSFIGYLPEEIKIGDQSTINVALVQDLIGLEEVVVIGYGNMKKADLTGSVSAINEGDMVKTAAPNITSTLSGKLAGVITHQVSGRPGDDSPTFLVRGKSTFDPDNIGTNNPLVIVDGIERDFNRIDPNDIESITILKDAASAAIYGSRGANGVILVTTKRGTNAKPKITYSTSYTSQKPTFRPEYMNAGEYAQYLNEAYINKDQAAPFTEEEVLQFQDGTLPSTDWWSEMMNKSAPGYQNNLAVNGKNDRTAYFLSLGQLYQGGLYEMANYKRYNIRSNIDTKLSDNLSVSLDISGRNDKTTSGIIGEEKLYQTLETAIPTISAYVPEELRVPGDKLGLNYNGTAGSPMGEAIYSGYIKGENYYLESKLGLNYNIPFIKGLSVKVDYSYDERFTKEKKWSIPYTLNYYTRKNGLTLTIPSQSVITLDQKIEERKRKTFQGGLNYARSFGKHSVTALLLFEQMDYRYDILSGHRQDFMATSIDQLFAGGEVGKDNDGKASEDARQGYVGRITYNYNEKYLFQANARYDGSYNFPNGRRWGFFPAFSAGWRISEESFMGGFGLLSNLKLRASWGKFGNDKVYPFYYLPGYTYSSGMVVGGTYQSGIMDTGIPNDLITWETATNTNYGFDFGLFGGKLSGEFDYFYKKTTGILIARIASLPMTVGSSLPKENLGIVDNHGIESVLRYRGNTGSLMYEIEGNLTYATSKVIYMDEAIDVPETMKKTGRPFDGRYGYTALGLFQTQEEIDASPEQDGNGNKSIHPGDIKYLDLNGDSIIDGKDQQYIGKGATPELIFGLNLKLQYKNFSFIVNFQGASNYTRYLYLNSFEKDYNTYKVLEDSWRVGNEDAKYPRLEGSGHSPNNSLYSTYWLEDGFYIKMRNIELSYTIAKKPLLKKIGVEELTISASGRNLLTIAKKDGFDPEGTNNRYPIMQTMSIGLNIVF